MEVDTWSDEVALLQSLGWVFTAWSRYDPTTAEGVTPTGKAFNGEVRRSGAGEAAVCTLTIAGNTRQQTENLRAGWEPADATRKLIERTYRSFPGNQR